MSLLIRFPLKDGGEVFVETSPDPDAPGPIARGGPFDAQETFDAALAKIRPVADAVFKQIKQLATSPDEVGVELGITLKTEAGVVIAKTAAEGNLKLSIKWKAKG